MKAGAFLALSTAQRIVKIAKERGIEFTLDIVTFDDKTCPRCGAHFTATWKHTVCWACEDDCA